jgi:hypothetical protein
MEARTAHVRLDLDMDAEPISGQVASEGAEPVSFTGYTGLIAALESIRAGERQEVPT